MVKIKTNCNYRNRKNREKEVCGMREVTNERTKKELYVCTKIRLCGYLLDHGFRYLRESTDIKNPSRKVWLFKESDKLRKAVEDYYNRKEFINRE